MDNESSRAQVGQGSLSIGITFSPAVEMAFERALQEAKAQSRPVLTTEQVLIELLHENTATELLSSAGVDVDALRADLIQHVGSDTATAHADEEPEPVAPLQNAMRRAVIKALASNQKSASGADILEAILVEGETHAADVLRQYGLTAQSAENINLDRYLQRNKEQAKRLAELEERARSQRKRTEGVTSANTGAAQLELRSAKDAGGTPGAERQPGHKVYLLRISSDDDQAHRILFKAALSRNGILDLYVEETPFEIQFVASTIVGLFEAVEGGHRLKVELLTELEGQTRVISGFSGSAGAIFRDPRARLGQRSGALD